MANILIVEDEETISSLLKELLQQQNHECATADSAEQALTLLDQSVFDLIILDYFLLYSNALQVLAFLAEEPRHHDTSVIISTSMGGEVSWWNQFGKELPPIAQSLIKEYVKKPYTIEEMDLAVQRVLALPKGSRAVRPLASQLAPKHPSEDNNPPTS